MRVSSFTYRVPGVRQVVKASVVAHVVVATLQRRGPAQDVHGPGAAAADVRRVDDGV